MSWGSLPAMDVRRDAPFGARKSRLLARWGAPILLGLGLAACAGSQTATQTPTTIPALPPLPTSPLTAMPAQVDGLVEVDVDKLRGSEVWASVRELKAGSCLDTANVQRFLEGTDRVVVATPQGAPEEVVIALGGNPGVVNADSVVGLLTELAHIAGQPAVTPVGVTDHRLEGLSAHGLTIAELAPGLVVVVSEGAFPKLAAAYDVAGRTPAAAPDDLATDGGSVRAFSNGGDELDRLLKRVPADLGQPLQGSASAVSVDTEADGVHLHLRSRLQSPQAVTQLMQTVAQRLRSAALVLRLMGLPSMDQRLIGEQEGAILDYRLHLTWKEAGRLLKLGEMEGKNQLLKACDIGAHRAMAAGAQP